MPVAYRVFHDHSTGYTFVPTEPVGEPPVSHTAPERCPTCGHDPDQRAAVAGSVYAGPIVPDVVPSPEALQAAHTATRVLLETASRRRPLSAAARHASPLVVRYIKVLQPSLQNLPVMRLRNWHASQPHRWAVEANALVVLDRPHALAARFEPDPLGRWTCTAFRILRAGSPALA